MTPLIGRAIAVAALLATSLGGCSNSTTTTTPTPTHEKVTETFTGTLNSGGLDTHPFSAKSSGDVTATLTSLSPDSTVAIGVIIGTYSYQACSPVVTNNTAKVNSVMVGVASSAIALCVAVYDVGNVKEATTYTVTVTHY